jgi:hypothetical protein
MSQTDRHQVHSPTAPPPAPPVADAPDSPTASEGRDERGRFTANNRFGPGNPFARRTAAFRKAIAEAVTEEMIAAVVAKLAELALAGDVAAIKLFLAYTVGKPLPAVNPDTLDIEELRQYEQELLPGATLGSIMTSPSPEVFLETARIMRPQLSEVCVKKVLDRIEELDAAEREAAADEAAAAAAPNDEPEALEESGLAAGTAGREGRPERRRPAPSDNGDNGGGRPAGKRHREPGRDGRRARERDDRQGPGTTGCL